MAKFAKKTLVGALLLLSTAINSAWAEHPQALEKFADNFKDQRSCMMGVSVVHDYMSVLKSLPDAGWQALIEESDMRVDLMVKAELIKYLSTDEILEQIGMTRSSILVYGGLIEGMDDYDRINARDYNSTYWHKHFVHLNNKCYEKFKEFEVNQQVLDSIKAEASEGARMDKSSSWDDFSELYLDLDWTLDAQGNKVPKKQQAHSIFIIDNLLAAVAKNVSLAVVPIIPTFLDTDFVLISQCCGN